MGCVYLAWCEASQKGYVGFTFDLDRRKMGHKRDAEDGSPLVFHKAIRKYGWDSFEWSVLYEDDDNDREWLGWWEKKFIRELKTKTPNGYNMTDGGDGGSGTRSEETIRKIVAFHTGRKRPQSTLDKLSAVMMGRKRSEESREKQKTTWKTKEYKRPREAVEKTVAAHRGVPCSEETKKKISEALTGKMKGVPKSEETKKRMSESAKRLWDNRKAGLIQSCAVVTLSGR